MQDDFIALKKTARLTGLLYLIWVFTGIYSVFIIPLKIFVPGDDTATVKKILANEFLFRTSIFNDIISNTLWVFLVLLLYRLFKQVNERQAKLLVALVIVQIPAVFFMEALNISSLMIFKGELLSTFEFAQRKDLGLLFLKINAFGTIVLETFWGLWLIPFGQLVYKSGFIPPILGVFLVLDGIALILHSFTSLLFPAYQSHVKQFTIPFWILGEISIMVWLLIKGVKIKI